MTAWGLVGCGVQSSAGWRMGLRVGDSILDINSRPMAGVTHEALLSALQDGGAELMMVVDRKGKRHKLKNRSAFIQDLGLTVEVTKKGLVQVKDVKPASAAEAAQLSVGDVIIDINGKTVLKKSLTQVIATLRSEMGPEVSMVVCSQPHEAVLERDYETKKHQPAASGKKAKRPKYTVEVKRGITAEGYEPLGLSLVTEGNHHICGQVGNGPAFRAGVRQGDYLVAINGVKMTKRDHEHVLQTLTENTESFTLSITRAAGEPGPKKAFAEPAPAPAADGKQTAPPGRPRQRSRRHPDGSSPRTANCLALCCHVRLRMAIEPSLVCVATRFPRPRLI